MAEQPDLFGASVWLETRDGDPTVRSVFDRHYSRRHYRDGRSPKLFMGPGEKMVLKTPCARAVFGWRKFISDDGQEGVSCAFFRNENAGKSSDLIRAAMAAAHERWPGERLYTYVDARQIRSTNPGACFKAAGWGLCGMSKGGLVILEYLPPDG